MKKLFFIFLIMFPLLIHAEWKLVSTSTASGDKHYVDTDRLKKTDGYIYFWSLLELSEPDQSIKSMTEYNQVDCKLSRSMVLTRYFYNESMGR